MASVFHSKNLKFRNDLIALILYRERIYTIKWNLYCNETYSDLYNGYNRGFTIKMNQVHERRYRDNYWSNIEENITTASGGLKFN